MKIANRNQRGSFTVIGILCVCLAALALWPQPAQAAVTEAWVQRYSNVVSNSADDARKVVSDAVGDIIVTGGTYDGITSYDMLTIKYSGADGAVLWQQRYNGPANSDDYAFTVAVDSSGNVVVTGYSHNGTNNDFYTAKYAAADGALLWEKRYNGPGNGDDFANAVAVDSSSNVVVTGYSHNGTNNDFYTAKYAAADGALLWEKRYNGPANSDNYANAVVVDNSGNVVVTGYSYNAANSDYYTAKYAAADGALLWEKRYNGPADSYDQATAVAVDGSGNLVVTGYSVGTNSNGDYYTAKYAAANGALLWEKRYNGPANGDDSGQAVAVDSSGNVVVTGYSHDGTNNDFYTAKYAAADGALLWEKRFNGPANNDDFPAALVVDVGGNVVVTGYSVGGNGSRDYYSARYAAANGSLLWEKRYDSPATSDDQATSVAVDSSGNVMVTGYSVGTNSNGDYYTAKYAAANGTLLWEKRHNGPANNSDQANAVAVDGSGNVVVTGCSDCGGARHDYYTAKYAAANGALLWQRTYNGPANNSDQPNAVAVDSSGNAVVTGTSYGTNFNGDYYTAKYAAATGALLWEKRYNGPANSDDGASAVAVDGSGNVVVTGNSVGGNGIANYYTAKYAAASGALLWEKRYNGPANSGDYAYAVAVDSSGNVVVTGSSHNGNNNDYYTAKYAAADGALLWEKRYNSPENGEDSANAVAVDSSGNVVVTGYSHNGTNNDFYTAKYAAADGALLWEKRYNGPANGDDTVGDRHSLALGPSGMVAVTGSSDADIGPGTTYDYATVVYRELLVITAQPQLQAVFTGSNATFSVSVTNATPPVSYLWRFNGSDLPGATNESLTIINVQLANAGEYQVVITDSTGASTISALASLSLLDASPPSVETLASSGVATNRATLNGAVNPNGRLTTAYFEYGLDSSYGSYTPAVNLGSRENLITMSNTVEGLLPSATYHFRLAVFYGGVTNYGAEQTFTTLYSPAQLLVITSQPQSQSVLPSSLAVFSVLANSGFPIFYHWRKDGLTLSNGGQISGVTSPNLAISNALPGNAGNYCVVVSNFWGSVTSQVAVLVVTNDLRWTFRGHAFWVAEAANTFHSGAITDFQESLLETTVGGAGTLAFWWKVSSEMDYDILEFSIDAVVQRRISGEEDWQQLSFALATGIHTLSWRYVKDDATSNGQDRAWLKDVVMVPAAGPPVIVAQPASQT
jgi:uncharacterized delta-60 repeat protein